jgi:hypothetical protein
LERNRSSGWPDVSPKAKVFVHEYSVCGNITSACKRVSIGRDRGMRMLRDPIIRAYLDSLEEGLRNDTIITRAFVELQMLETLEQVNGDVDVPNVTKDGEVVWGPRFNGTGKIALLKEMKGLAGMNKEQGIDGTGVTINIDLNAAGYVAPEVEVNSETTVVSDQ